MFGPVVTRIDHEDALLKALNKFWRGKKNVENYIPPLSDIKTSLNKKACRVPFNSSAPAQALAVNTDVPAPCTYNITFRKHRIQGGASLKYTAARGDFDNGNEFRQSVPDLEKVTWMRGAYFIPGKLFRGKLPRYTDFDSSFLQMKTKCGIYSLPIEEYDSELPISVPLIKEKEEPLYYSFPFEMNKTTLKYKGIHWSKMQSERSTLYAGDPSTPGVGEYNLLDKPPKPFDVYCNNVKFFNKRKAKSLRTLDRQTLRLKYLDEPGPGHYEVVMSDLKRRSIYDSGTFSRAERFKTREDYQHDFHTEQMIGEIPDPNKKKSFQVCWPPFNSSRKRTSNKSDESPAYYNIWNHTIAYNIAKELYFPRIVAPFNSSSERASLFVGTEDTPEPGDYDIDRFPFKPRRRIIGARNVHSYKPPIKLVPAWNICQKPCL